LAQIGEGQRTANWCGPVIWWIKSKNNTTAIEKIKTLKRW